MASSVYVLHFDPPYRHARHYVGWVEDGDVLRRLAQHLAGQGSPLVRAAVAAGCQIIVAHVFASAARGFERNIKRRKDVCSWCNCCSGVRRRPLPHPSRAKLNPRGLYG